MLKTSKYFNVCNNDMLQYKILTKKRIAFKPHLHEQFFLDKLLSIFIARVDDQQVFLNSFHIFPVVGLHEQISDLTIFPCQGKASLPDFP